MNKSHHTTSRHVKLINQLKQTHEVPQIRLAIPTRYSHTTIFSNSGVSHTVPLYANIRHISAPESKPENRGITPSVFQIISTFISATLAAFSGLYIADSIAAQQIYMQKIMTITDSEIGLLSSCIFFPSLFMPIFCAPLLDKFGAIWSGIAMNVFNVLVSVPMVFCDRSYTGLFAMRVLAGLFQEASFSVQSALIVRYLPAKLTSLGFGVCMSVATSANLISFFAIPLMMKGTEGELFDRMYDQTFWLNFYVSAISLALFVGFCLPLLKLDKEILRVENEAKKVFVQEQEGEDEGVMDSFSSCLDDEKSITEVIEAKIERNKLQSENKKKLQEFIKKELKGAGKTPNNMPFVYKILKYFSLSMDFWIINITFCQLLAVCYGAQTMLITYLAMHVDFAETAGVVRSVASIVGGPLSGFLVQFCGQRPMLQLLVFALACFSFISLLFFKIVSPYIGMFFIGLFDGSASALGKSLFTYVCDDQQLNAAYAVSGVILSFGQFAYPPISGGFSGVNWPNEGSGIIWFWVIMLLIGILLSVLIIIRDRRYYGSKLSKKPI